MPDFPKRESYDRRETGIKASVSNNPLETDAMESVIIRRKDCPDAPPFTSLVGEVNLDAYDLVDEHGQKLNDEAYAEVRDKQATLRGEKSKQKTREPVIEIPVVRREPQHATKQSTHKRRAG